MDLAHLSSKVIATAKKAAEISRKINVSDWWERLMDINLESTRDKIARVRPSGWYGAVPAHEPMPTVKSPSAAPKSVVGIDGSQIYPDPENPVRWAYIQVARFKSGEKSFIEGEYIEIDSFTQMGEEEPPDLWFDPSRINSLRTLQEIQVAQKAALQYPDHVILVDNPLLPYRDYSQFDNRWLSDYVRRITEMKGQLLAGYISSPKSHLFYNLIALAENNDEIAKKNYAIDDSTLMRYGLGIGQRSAVFLHGSRRNLSLEKTEAGIYFFYLKIDRDEIARVEVPEWIALNAIILDQVHASVIGDCMRLGYPYTLISAHYQVVIPLTIGQELNQLALHTYQENHGYYHVSTKNRLKR